MSFIYRCKWRVAAWALAVWPLALPPNSPALEREVVVSVYQGPCRDGNFEANLATARTIIEEARARNSDFPALPETFLSGYGSAEQVRRGARPIDDPQQLSVVSRGLHFLRLCPSCAAAVGLF